MAVRNGHRKSEYSNNKGFSLVEVLVAMAVLSIVSFGIIEAFSNSAQVNARARREENANALATDLAEQLRALSLDELKKKYTEELSASDLNDVGKPEKTGYMYDETTGNYIFYVADAEGNDGEPFWVKAELDAASYSELNAYSVPQYSNLDSTDNFVVRQEFDKYNSLAAERYVREVPGADEDAAKNAVVKKAKVMVVVKKNTATDRTTYPYIQEVSVSVSYRYGAVELLNNTVYEQSKKLDSLTTVKPVYLFYSPYQRSGTAIGAAVASEDQIELNYNYKDIDVTEEEAKSNQYNYNVFLTEQSVLTETGSKIQLNSNNISAYVNDAEKRFSSAVTEGTLQLGSAKNISPVNIYSNITDWNQFGSGGGTPAKNTLSDGQNTQSDKYLYSMNIKVYYRDNTEPLVELKTTKNN